MLTFTRCALRELTTNVWLNTCAIANRNNNLTLIRILAASSVVVGHSMILDKGTETQVFHLFSSGHFGFLAVAVFFALSGFLITQSYDRRPDWFVFLEARVLRIFPGLIFSAVVTCALVLVFGKQRIDLKTLWQFIIRTSSFDLDLMNDYFKSNPINAVNGSIWTLRFEFRYYILVLLLGLCGFFRRPLFFIAFLALILTAAVIPLPAVLLTILAVPNTEAVYLSLPYCFLLGCAFYVFRSRVPLSWLLLVVLLILAPRNWPLKVTAFSYAAFFCGFHPKLYMPKFRDLDDISYGIYIFSFPIQQLLVMNLKPISDLRLLALSYPATVLAAWISWRLVEKPALKLKGFRPFKNFNKSDGTAA